MSAHAKYMIVLEIILLMGLFGDFSNAKESRIMNGVVPPAILVDGTQQATLVIPKSGPERFVAQEDEKTIFRPDQLLVKIVKEITGVELKVIEEGQTIAGPVIHIGQTDRVKSILGDRLKKLDLDGYLLLSRPGELLIVGGNAYGTYFGVSTLLQKYAGVRWLLPGPLGRVIPKKERLVLEGVNLIDEPVMKSRGLSGVVHNGGTPEDLEWLYLNRLHLRYVAHHNMYNIMNSAKYGKTHPEYYPLIGGRRVIPPPDCGVSWQPCLTHPDVIKICAEAAIEYFDKTGEECYSICLTDGGGFCECPNCEATNKGGTFTNESQRVFTFWNRVAEQVEKKYPNKLLCCMAYASYRTPPIGFRPHPMLVPFLVAPEIDKPGKIADRSYPEIDQWVQSARQIGYYDWMEDFTLLVPRIYTKQLAHLLRYASKRGVVGFYGEAYPNWSLSGPKFYAAARLMWNPQEDPDVILRDFCQSLFGPAAAPMSRHFERCEEAWKTTPCSGVECWNNPRQFLCYTSDILDASLADLERALQLTGHDDLLKTRVQFYRNAFEFVRLAAPSVESLRLLYRKEPLGKVLQSLAQSSDPCKQVAKVWKQHYSQGGLEAQYGFFPLVGRAMTNDGAGLLAEMGVGLPEAEVKMTIVRKVMTDAVREARKGLPQDFAIRLNRAVTLRMQREMKGIELVKEDSSLARLRDEIITFSSKAIPASAVTTPPVVDGDLEDPCWQTAARGSGFSSHNIAGATDARTEIAICHDDTNLYLAAWCHQPRAEVEARPGDPGQDVNAWNDNSIELFFNRDESNAPYHQIVINAASGVFDMRADDSKWLCAGLRRATKIYEDHWTLEAAIPLTSLGMSAKMDKFIRFNAARNRFIGEKQEVSAWFPSQVWLKDVNNRGLLVLE